MSRFSNKLKLLEEENNFEFQMIEPEETRKEAGRMIQYIMASPLSLFQIQIIRKDIIAMAREAGAEKISLKEKLGIEPKEFCDQVIANAGKPAWHEHILKPAIDVLQFLALYSTICYFFLWGMPKTYGITVTEGALYVLGCGVWSTVVNYLWNKSALVTSRRRKMVIGVTLEAILIILAVTAILMLKKSQLGQTYIIAGRGWLFVLILDLLTIAAKLAWKRYWDYHSIKLHES